MVMKAIGLGKQLDLTLFFENAVDLQIFFKCRYIAILKYITILNHLLSEICDIYFFCLASWLLLFLRKKCVLIFYSIIYTCVYICLRGRVQIMEGKLLKSTSESFTGAPLQWPVNSGSVFSRYNDWGKIWISECLN